MNSHTLLKRILAKPVLARSLLSTQNRAFSSAAFSVKSKFEEAYKAKMAAKAGVTEKV